MQVTFLGGSTHFRGMCVVIRVGKAFAPIQKDAWTQVVSKEIPETPGAEEALHSHVHKIKVALASAKTVAHEAEERAYKT